MLTVYGVYHSRASRVIWLTNELGLDFHHVPVIQADRAAGSGIAMTTRSPEFLAINPAGYIPVIDDDGLVLRESLAITLHLARKHGGAMGPSDHQEDAMMSMWTLWAATEVEPYSLQILLEQGKAEKDATVIAAATERLRAPFALLDRHLATEHHPVGNRFTVADINVAEILRYAVAVPDLFDAAPRVKSWLAACHARPAFVEMYRRRLAETP